ncbi:hypothetical protein [Streptomyces sp. TE33382]
MPMPSAPGGISTPGSAAMSTAKFCRTSGVNSCSALPAKQQSRMATTQSAFAFRSSAITSFRQDRASTKGCSGSWVTREELNSRCRSLPSLRTIPCPAK